ncbi:sensor histidine kinase [Desulfopila aestuarii]|uniref:histidine kinase n=1 Tax=Desulfopila aestuarii DSM 18488 TaxID=1121416 RepID=A0A1M7Y930_9BACT|nr:PAS domain-containing sensor histidine kinase [Desulfopila aestuarii]SHO49130.1 two-component system, NtrC family, sensor kinase [Desulfopila aestuarii DSM 18488]
MNTKNPFTIFDWIAPNAVRNPVDADSGQRSYAQLSMVLYSSMLLIAIVPVLVVGWLGYQNYNRLFQISEQEELQWKIDGKIKSIEHMVTSLKSVVQFTARRDRYMELTENDNLEELFIRIQHQYAFFADLGVIDQSGIQQAYYGPYNLQGADYSKEKWLQEVFDKGVYISGVYTGYRKVPHFAIAVSNLDPKTRQLWVLRATIDASTLQEFIDTIKTNATDDLFLVDGNGVLQTSSGYYGKTLAKFGSPVEVGIHHKLSDRGEDTFEAIGTINNTPWSLVLLKRRYIHHDEWKNFRARFIFIIFTCILMSLIVVHTLVKMLTGLIKKTDEMQIAMLKEAEHTDKLASIGRLAAGVGHEINNPLAIISQKAGLIEDLLEMTSDFEYKDTVKNNLGGISKSVERCKAITHRLLGFARRTDVTEEPLQVNDIIGEVLQFLDNAMLYSRIKLELHLQSDLPEAVSDRLQLQQIFLNIINNAIDAIGKDGVISITTHTVAGDVRVVIQDNGPGIDKQILPHIFEPFYTTKETGKGTGLGLSICYGLIKKLGGDITVRSVVGQGTAFTITIPVHREEHGE